MTWAIGPKTILNAWIALSSFWTWAERDLGLPHIIRGKVNRPRPRRRLSAAYTEAEIRALLAACEKCGGWDRAHGQRMDVKRPSALRDRALMLVLLDTGIRASELTALKMRDYEPKRGQMIIHHGKGDKKRVVFVGSAAKQALWSTWPPDRAQGRMIRSSPLATAQPSSAPACGC